MPAPKPAPDTRSALGRFAKCLGLPLVIAALVFLSGTRGETFGGLFAPVGRSIAASVELVFSALLLVAAYHPIGLLLLGVALTAGCACYFLKTGDTVKESNKKVDSLARRVCWVGANLTVLAILGIILYPYDEIRYFEGESYAFSALDDGRLLNGAGGNMDYMNCRRISEAYLSSNIETRKRLAVEVNGVMVASGQHPAENCRMLSFNKVHYGYSHASIFTKNQDSNTD